MTDQKDEQTPLEAEILREVAEEMQEEQFKKLWKKISPFVTGAIALALLVTAGFEFYRNYDSRRSLEESEQMKTALSLIDSADAEKGAEILKTLTETSTRGYRYIAAFHYADYLVSKGKDRYEEAIHALDRVIADPKAPQPFKNLAFFDKIILQRENGNLDIGQTRDELKKIILKKDPWAAMALEFSAELALREGNIEDAVEDWKEILDMSDIPEDKRARISEYVTFLENNAETGK